MKQTTETTVQSDTQLINDEIHALQHMLKAEAIDLTTEAEWREIAEHIRVHRFLINQVIPWTISWEDAVFSWYENVMRPIMQAADAWEIRSAFPDKTRGQLYLAVTTHWHYLKERDGSVTPEYAARDFAGHYGRGLASWFSRFLQPAR